MKLAKRIFGMFLFICGYACIWNNLDFLAKVKVPSIWFGMGSMAMGGIIVGGLVAAYGLFLFWDLAHRPRGACPSSEAPAKPLNP
jgi:hypothetical protein